MIIPPGTPTAGGCCLFPIATAGPISILAWRRSRVSGVRELAPAVRAAASRRTLQN